MADLMNDGSSLHRAFCPTRIAVGVIFCRVAEHFHEYGGVLGRLRCCVAKSLCFDIEGLLKTTPDFPLSLEVQHDIARANYLKGMKAFQDIIAKYPNWVGSRSAESVLSRRWGSLAQPGSQERGQ
jgi:hypothetical protein